MSKSEPIMEVMRYPDGIDFFEDSNSHSEKKSFSDAELFDVKNHILDTDYGKVPCLLEVKNGKIDRIQETYAVGRLCDSNIKSAWYRKGTGEIATITLLDKEKCVFVDNGESIVRDLIAKAVTGYGSNGYVNAVASMFRNRVLAECPQPLEFDNSQIYFKNGHCDSGKRCFVEKSVEDITLTRSNLSYKAGLWSEKYWNTLSDHCTLPEHFLAFMGLCYFPYVPFKKGLMNLGLLGNETKSTQCGAMVRINDSIYGDLFIVKKASQVFGDEKGYNDGDIGKTNLLIINENNTTNRSLKYSKTLSIEEVKNLFDVASNRSVRQAHGRSFLVKRQLKVAWNVNAYPIFDRLDEGFTLKTRIFPIEWVNPITDETKVYEFTELFNSVEKREIVLAMQIDYALKYLRGELSFDNLNGWQSEFFRIVEDNTKGVDDFTRSAFEEVSGVGIKPKDAYEAYCKRYKSPVSYRKFLESLDYYGFIVNPIWVPSENKMVRLLIDCQMDAMYNVERVEIYSRDSELEGKDKALPLWSEG